MGVGAKAFNFRFGSAYRGGGEEMKGVPQCFLGKAHETKIDGFSFVCILSDDIYTDATCLPQGSLFMGPLIEFAGSGLLFSPLPYKYSGGFGIY